MATMAAVDAFQRTWLQLPIDETGSDDDWAVWRKRYEHLWALYQNDKFEDLAAWASYKARYGLYRFTRLLYNPTRRLADFYAGMVYPGILTEDGLPADGWPLAIPLGNATAPELRLAVAQIWQWSNWQNQKHLLCRWGSLLGNVFVEIVDDPMRGKVWLDVVWPGLLDALELDSRGNVVRYAMQYSVKDEADRLVVYRREVDKETIRELYDDEIVLEEENPYGFVPAVWFHHSYTGGLHGNGAIRSLAKLDAINEQISVLADKVRRVNNSPILIWSGGSMAPVVGQQAKAGPTPLQLDPEASREELRILQGPQGGNMQTITPDGVAETLELVRLLMEEVEQDHPELTMYRELRRMSSVTAPGAERMLGDAAAYVQEARGNYDEGSRRLFQMAIAVAGYRANRGDWGRPLTSAQRKFLPFDLRSYERGELNLTILPRPMIPETPVEAIQRQRMELDLERDRMEPLPGGVAMRLMQQIEQ